MRRRKVNALIVLAPLGCWARGAGVDETGTEVAAGADMVDEMKRWKDKGEGEGEERASER